MNFLFGIISYHRPDRQLTLDMLTANGIPKEDIILSLNAAEDYALYKKYEDRATLICRSKNNAAGNRNNVRGATSPARAYGGILKPAGTDSNGDVVYKYNQPR